MSLETRTQGSFAAFIIVEIFLYVSPQHEFSTSPRESFLATFITLKIFLDVLPQARSATVFSSNLILIFYIQNMFFVSYH